MLSLLYDNPRLLVLTICLILVTGLSSLSVLPRMEDPPISQRGAIIHTAFPGARAERVEGLVTERIEVALQEIEDIKELRSTSRNGMSTVTIELKDHVVEVAEVWSRIRDKLDDAVPLLPRGAADPEFEDYRVAAFTSIVALIWETPGEPNYAILRRLAESLEDRIRELRGTLDVEWFGTPFEEITVEVKQDALSTMGVTMVGVSNQVQASDAKLSAGQLRTEHGQLLLEVDSALRTLERIRRIPISYADGGRFVELADVANVVKGITHPQSSLALVDGKPAIVLGVLIRSEFRVDHWTTALNQSLTECSENLPRGIRLKVLFEQNRYVSSRLAVLLQNLMLGAAAILGVVWFMMGWRSAIVVGTTLPLATLMVLSGMQLLGIPIDQMSITGLIVALGLLIDNAIVMVDDVRARLRTGVSFRNATACSVRHLAVPLFGSTVTTALSFSPIAVMPGPAGEFVSSIALSVILAIVSSFLLALTVTPSMIALLERHLRNAGSSRSQDHLPSARSWWHDGFFHSGLASAYRRSLAYTFEHPWLGVTLGLVLPVAGFLIAPSLTEQFFPPAERDQLQIEMTLPSQSSLTHTEQVARDARRLLLTNPHVEAVDWFVGESAPQFYYNQVANVQAAPNYAQALVQLNTTEGLRELIRQWQTELKKAFPEAIFLVRQLEQGPPFIAPIEMRLIGPDLDVLRKAGNQARLILSDTPDVVYTSATLAETVPKLSVQVDEQQARLAGLDHATVALQLDAILEGTLGGSVLEATEELPVRFRVADARRGDLSQIASVDLLPARDLAADARRTAAGSYGKHPHRTITQPYVPLSAIAQVILRPEISSIVHFNTMRMNEVQAFITAGVLPEKVQADFERRLAESDFSLPVGYHFEFGGEGEVRDDAVGDLMSSVHVLIVLVIATLVVTFNSFRIAGLVASVAILSVGLSFAALALFGYPFGFMAIVGTMGLVGVAINDTIIVLAALRSDRQARTGQVAAVRDVVVRSTRHVLSTTLTTIVGFLPLMLCSDEVWPPLATSIAGGVGGATLLALYFIPSSYILFMSRDRNPEYENGLRTQGADGPANTISRTSKQRLMMTTRQAHIRNDTQISTR